MTSKKRATSSYSGFAVQLVRNGDGETFFATSGTAQQGSYSPAFYWKRKDAVAHKRELIEHDLGPCKVVPVQLTMTEIV